MALDSRERARIMSAKLVRKVGAAAERARANRRDRNGRTLTLQSRLLRARAAENGQPGGHVASANEAVGGAHDDVHREREVKLDAPNGFVLPRLDGLGGLRQLGDDEVDLDAAYFDTDDLRLTRAGLSLRYRDKDGWTAKLPLGRRATELDRAEHSIPGGPGEPPAPAKDLVRAWTRSAPLRIVANLRTRRRRVRLGRRPGVTDIEVADDRVLASVPGGSSSRFRELEVEFEPSAPKKARKAVVSRLLSAGARPGDTLPKITRTLGRQALRPSDVPAPKKLRRRATVHDAVQAAVGASLHRLVTNDPDVRLGDDPEAVHQARVATRRLRSDLRTFRPVLDRSVTEPLRAELRWLGSKLGAVRDADVLAELLRAKLDELSETDTSSGDALLRTLAQQRSEAHDALIEAMRGRRYAELLDHLVALARRPPVKRKVGKKRATTVMPRLVRRPWRNLADTVTGLGPSPADAELHEARKRAKQARYAAEAALPVVGRPAQDFAKAMTRLQDVLGAHQDAVVARSWLHDAALRSDDPRVVYVAGELAGLAAAERQARRSEWRSVWRRARRKRLRRWF